MIHFTEITDFQAPELDVYARLTEAQLLNRFEPKKGMFIAESPKVIQRAWMPGVSRCPCWWNGATATRRPRKPLNAAEMSLCTRQKWISSQNSPASS